MQLETIFRFYRHLSGGKKQTSALSRQAAHAHVGGTL